jgi:hypothetical protein
MAVNQSELSPSPGRAAASASPCRCRGGCRFRVLCLGNAHATSWCAVRRAIGGARERQREWVVVYVATADWRSYVRTNWESIMHIQMVPGHGMLVYRVV